jgi:hypothetical protein
MQIHKLLDTSEPSAGGASGSTGESTLGLASLPSASWEVPCAIGASTLGLASLPSTSWEDPCAIGKSMLGLVSALLLSWEAGATGES